MSQNEAIKCNKNIQSNTSTVQTCQYMHQHLETVQLLNGSEQQNSRGAAKRQNLLPSSEQ